MTGKIREKSSRDAVKARRCLNEKEPKKGDPREMRTGVEEMSIATSELAD